MPRRVFGIDATQDPFSDYLMVTQKNIVSAWVLVDDVEWHGDATEQSR